MSIRRPEANSIRWVCFCLALSLFAVADALAAQSGPSPYRLVDDWAQLPGGREMGAVGKVTVDPDGRHIWAVIRCDAPGDQFGWECLDSDLDPIIKFAPDGRVVESFGSGLFIWPHGIDVDGNGNVWVTDAVGTARIPAGDTRGHQVIKFSPTGEVLLRLGTPGREGGGRTGFTSPADVAVADNGDVFIADGHNNVGNNRVVKFTNDGRYIMEWGKTGYAPSEFRALHAIDIDANGRVFVGDRSNNRIQIFDQAGTHLTTWTQFGRPSGIAFDRNGRILVADSESDDVQNPGWEMGIRIGDAQTGWVSEFIVYQWGDPRSTAGNGAEFVAVDVDGNLYGGEPSPRRLQKYMRVR
ncbi:MAG: peptidyl-alpha-hydroxyglycine alpha-amidating lyase family protein [Gemmatimonadota bacterium]|nr:peptidyl-alpha-hydroxyglycine alpha-amidating lyase family protein [Gemmatimonadota bacterium]MDH3421367.1 peptidyl-alpha-hydroxyglycine alpha-amidating lyase family protein [Gemmatimonadota bacterium]